MVLVEVPLPKPRGLGEWSMLMAGLADGPETEGSTPSPLKSSGGQAPHTPHLKAGHQRGLPPRRRPPSDRSVTGSWGRCCCLCIGRCFAVPAGLDCRGGGERESRGGGAGGGMFGGVLVLHYQLPLCKVCMLSLVPEL